VALIEKIKSADELALWLETSRKEGQKVVFTNGCFDLLHPGHLHYLEKARKMGDILVVGINSDESIRRIKGSKRPLTPESDRLQMLAALECVSFVTVFNEPDPLNLILKIKPDVLVKGGDWSVDRIIGKDKVEERGGKVVSISLTPGYSTTALIERIVERYGTGSSVP